MESSENKSFKQKMTSLKELEKKEKNSMKNLKTQKSN